MTSMPRTRSNTPAGGGKAPGDLERRLRADAADAQLDASPALRARTMRALNDAHPGALGAAPSVPFWRAPFVLAGVAVVAVAAVGAAVLFTTPTPGPTGAPSPIAGDTEAPPPSPTLAFTRVERASQAALRTSVESPLLEEADALLADGRRMTRMAMAAIPKRFQPNDLLR